jgi:glycosyltransferase involved in cell wall biosynthesis
VKTVKIAMILTNGFDPDPRVYKEAKTLVSLGHEVHILCWDRISKYKDKQFEKIDGINIVRFFGAAVYGTGYKQLGKFLDFKNNVYTYIKDKSFDAIHCHDFDGLYIGHNVNKKLKLKLTYDEHDLFYMYFANRKGVINKAAYYFILNVEKIFLKNVDTHIVVTPKMAKMYASISKNVVIVNNAPYKELFTNIEKTSSSKLRIGFIGSVRYFEEMRALINASQKYKDSVEIVINGAGIALDEIKDYCTSFNNVTITGAYSIKELEKLYQNIDVTYAFYPGKTSEISMPNKFYESIITETPIIANESTEFGEEVKNNGLGYSISGNDLEYELKAIMEKLVNDKNELKSIIENMKSIKNGFLWEANEKVLRKIYED